MPWEGSENITHDFRMDRGNGAGSSRLPRDLTGEEGVAVRTGNRMQVWHCDKVKKGSLGRLESGMCRDQGRQGGESRR